MEKVVILFDAPGFTASQYDKVWEGLRAAGHANPKGLISHVGCAKPDGNWLVVDIWESAEAFQEFGKVLVPILESVVGDNPPQPTVIPAHYVHIGQHETELA